MSKNKILDNLGKCCNTCKRYDVMNGVCTLTNHYTHFLDNVCNRWAICDEFKAKQKKKEKRYEQLKLL